MDKGYFIFKRIAMIIPMLLIVSVIAFALSNLSAGDVAEITIRNEGGLLHRKLWHKYGRS